MNSDKSAIARQQLQNAYPKLRDLFTACGAIDLPSVAATHLLDAVAFVVNSQMLSTKSAHAIRQRLEQERDFVSCEHICDLSESNLRSCGLSRSKIRTIHEFAANYRADTSRYERWRRLGYDELESEVCAEWGLGSWSAEMLALFYFGHADLMPKGDLALNKAIENARATIDPDFDAGAARPYRSLLAMYLWRTWAVDFWDDHLRDGVAS